MRNSVKHIVGCLVTLAMVVAGARGLGHLVRPAGEHSTDNAFTQIDTFYHLPDDSLEVILYGSSHVFKNINVMKMYEDYGIGAYDYSWNWQKLNTTKLFIQDSLLSQSPKVAVIETSFVGYILKDVDMDGEIYYTRYLRNSKYKFQFLKQCFGNNLERWLSYYMPLAAFHDNWPNISRKSFNPIVNKRHYRMGYAESRAVKPVTLPEPGSVKPKRLSDESLAELNEIVDTLKARNVEIVFFTAPYKGGFHYAKAMTNYAQKKGCAYLNMFDHIDEMGIDTETDFQDTNHLNYDGATKAAAFLGKYLSEHYDLTDMREVEGNLWEQTKKANSKSMDEDE